MNDSDAKEATEAIGNTVAFLMRLLGTEKMDSDEKDACFDLSMALLEVRKKIDPTKKNEKATRE